MGEKQNNPKENNTIDEDINTSASKENETEPDISNILKNIKKNTTTNLDPEKKPSASKKTKLKKNIDTGEAPPRGLPKSRRPWKSVKTKFSTIKKSINRSKSFQKKMELREEIKHIKELSKSIKEQKKEENEMKKKRRAQNAERRLENERKSEVVQIIKNPAKLKRMRKKQLRMIEKRDLSKVKVV